MDTLFNKSAMDHTVISSHKKSHAAILATVGCTFVNRIYNEARRARIARSARLCPVVLTPESLAQHHKEASQTEILFTCWGLPFEVLTPDRFPSLQVVFYSGGSVKDFARPLLERGIQVVNAKRANAIAVAHFCLAQIILSCKGYFRNTRKCRNADARSSGGLFIGPGLYGEQIALLGMGAVARELAPLLRQCDLNVLAVDPYFTPAEADDLGVTPVTMEEAFAEAYVVSNHLPNLPELKRVLDRRLFASMRRDATFINTGRGAQVNEEDLIAVARKRSDLTMLLDVTDPEPPSVGSPFYELPNVQLSSHIAGALNDEVRRQGDFIIEEFERFSIGQPLHHMETLELLDRVA
jgi:phosphoglycerate dehydrogenase-like enzyme